jgi:D-aminopeptidase
VLPASLGPWTVGVLVQANFGGILRMNGAPVGVELGRYAFPEQGRFSPDQDEPDAHAGGSIMMVVATDAPLSDRNLGRLAMRAVMGLARTGSYAGNGSGDYVIAFSTAATVRRSTPSMIRDVAELPNERMNALFEATLEATEESIYNSLLRAVTVTCNGRTAEALPLERTLAILRKYAAIRE